MLYQREIEISFYNLLILIIHSLSVIYGYDEPRYNTVLQVVVAGITSQRPSGKSNHPPLEQKQSRAPPVGYYITAKMKKIFSQNFRELSTA